MEVGEKIVVIDEVCVFTSIGKGHEEREGSLETCTG